MKINFNVKNQYIGNKPINKEKAIEAVEEIVREIIGLRGGHCVFVSDVKEETFYASRIIEAIEKTRGTND